MESYSLAVNPNIPYSPPVCSMFNEITQYLKFFMFFPDVFSVMTMRSHEVTYIHIYIYTHTQYIYTYIYIYIYMCVCIYNANMIYLLMSFRRT